MISGRCDFSAIVSRVEEHAGNPARIRGLDDLAQEEAVDLAQGAPLLADTPLVTASARVVKQAERRGHRSARLLASRPDDDALTEAITLQSVNGPDWTAIAGQPVFISPPRAGPP